MGLGERRSAEAADAEVLRQASVFASGVLAIRDNDALLAIVAKAAALLGTAMAAVSIVDRDRQWLPIAIGLPGETPRAMSFCAYAILTPDQVFCVPDAHVDPRFSGNPLVIAPPFIRFYAGAPLVDEEGFALGALCAIDRQPRPPLSIAEQRALADLAREAVSEIKRSAVCRGYGGEALDHILAQVRGAVQSDNEPLVLALDRVVQTLERDLDLPAAPERD